MTNFQLYFYLLTYAAVDYDVIFELITLYLTNHTLNYYMEGCY